MLVFPRINPVAFQLGLIKVHWYGLLYLLSFILGWVLLNYRAKRFVTNSTEQLQKYPIINAALTSDQIGDLIFYIALGVIFGGRIGYMLFYDLSNFIHAPWIIIKVWEGGMSFHGGLLGVIFMCWLWARKQQLVFWDVTDLVAPLAPIGLAAGRLGNFINGELWGRVTKVPWAMYYPNLDNLPRHPSEIYEFLLEGVLLFVVLWIYAAKPRPRMAVSALFLIGYGFARCFCEFFRQPDLQYGYIAFGWLTMGQILSFPMIVIGVVLLWWAHNRSIG